MIILMANFPHTKASTNRKICILKMINMKFFGRAFHRFNVIPNLCSRYLKYQKSFQFNSTP